MWTSAISTASPSYRDTVQFPDRARSIDDIIAQIGSSLVATRILALTPTHLSKSGDELVALKVGAAQPASHVRDTMLRLELLQVMSPHTFMSLSNFLAGKSLMPDWHAVNAETYGLGKTVDSSAFLEATATRQRRAFWNGFFSVLAFGTTIRKDAADSEMVRLDFKEDSGVRDIFLSAIQRNGPLGSPERT